MSEALTPELLTRGYGITRSGTYTLTGNTFLLGKNGIRIEVSDVTLDLHGFTITASPETTACVSLRKGTHRICIQDGALQGGERGIASAGGGSSLRFENLHVFDYTFAAFQLRPCVGVHLTSCHIGRASAAPRCSLFGVLALPSTGFRGAEALLRGIRPTSSESAKAGRGLTFARVQVSDITPYVSSVAPSQQGDCRQASSWLARPSRRRWPSGESAAFITDTGYCINAETPCSFPMYRSKPFHEPKEPAERHHPGHLRGGIDGAHAHAVAIFGWEEVRGVYDDSEIAAPSRLPLGPRSDDFRSAWGGGSCVTLKNAEGAPWQVDDATENLAEFPSGVLSSRVQSSFRPGGVYVPGAMGSFVACYSASEKYYKQDAHMQPHWHRAPRSSWVGFKKAYPGGRRHVVRTW